MPFVDPTRDQICAFAQSPETGPVVMVNLLKFKPGKEGSYKEYGKQVGSMVVGRGGRIVYQGAAGPTVIGDEAWDEVLLVEYPSREAFLDMVQSEEYRAVVHLRTEAIEDSRLHPTFPGGSKG